MDYLQFQFGGIRPTLTTITLPTVTINGKEFNSETPGYRDRLDWKDWGQVCDFAICTPKVTAQGFSEQERPETRKTEVRFAILRFVPRKAPRKYLLISHQLPASQLTSN